MTFRAYNPLCQMQLQSDSLALTPRDKVESCARHEAFLRNSLTLGQLRLYLYP